jgi:hypothetical protein
MQCDALQVEEDASQHAGEGDPGRRCFELCSAQCPHAQMGELDAGYRGCPPQESRL